MSLTIRDAGRSEVPMSSAPRINVSNQMAIVWRRGKAKVNRLFGNRPPGTHIAHEPIARFPYEIVEMIVAHLAHDLDALKTCSLTCHSWRIVTAPHLHHTISLKEKYGIIHSGLKTLSKPHERGLMPLVKEIRVCAPYRDYPWFAPRTFSRRNLDYFSAFTNVQALKIYCTEIYRLIQGIERYSGHFLPTLRSITLWAPSCTSRQLSRFLSLFPNLDDIDIEFMVEINGPPSTTSSTELVPVSAPKLEGQLRLYKFYSVETWTDLIKLCGGLRFRHMDLCYVTGCTPILLEACAETLETIRIHIPYVPGLFEAHFHPTLPEFDLSQLRVLRSLQMKHWMTWLGLLSAPRDTAVMEVFSTIVSPVFSELVVILQGDDVADLPLYVKLFEMLRSMNETRPFELVFLIEDIGLYQEGGRQGKVRQEFAEALQWITMEGHLDFLESPPNIQINP